MVKGYAQTYEIDCRENFALMAKLNIIRILLFFVTNFDWPLQQFDMKNAFLYENLEEGYMEIPPGLEENFKRNRVCWLKKAMYGHEQPLKSLVWKVY